MTLFTFTRNTSLDHYPRNFNKSDKGFYNDSIKMHIFYCKIKTPLLCSLMKTLTLCDFKLIVQHTFKHLLKTNLDKIVHFLEWIEKLPWSLDHTDITQHIPI